MKFPWDVLLSFVLAVVLAIPLLRISRSQRRLTWASAVLLGTHLTIIALLLIADVPSRILYWFDAVHSDIAGMASWLAFMEGDAYIIVRDIVANTVQGIFFVIIVALVYFWGERQRKAGRFKS